MAKPSSSFKTRSVGTRRPAFDAIGQLQVQARTCCSVDGAERLDDTCLYGLHCEPSCPSEKKQHHACNDCANGQTAGARKALTKFFDEVFRLFDGYAHVINLSCSELVENRSIERKVQKATFPRR